MKILITGARGMLGQALARVWADSEPTLWDRDELDITDEAAVTSAITQLAPTIIINAAAYTDVNGAEHNQAAAFAVNETGVHNLATAAAATDATLVHYSTDYVFSGTNAAGYREDDMPASPLNVYGASKLAGEQALTASGARYYLLRTAWLYGTGGKNFVDTMIALGQKHKTVNVVNDQHGSPTYAADVARATRQLVTGTDEPGIYHTVNAGHATWYEFAQRIFEILQLPSTVVPIASRDWPQPAARPTYSILQVTRGPRLRPWQEALDEYLKNHQNR